MPAHLLEDYYEDVRWTNPKEVSLFHGCPNYREVPLYKLPVCFALILFPNDKIVSLDLFNIDDLTN